MSEAQASALTPSQTIRSSSGGKKKNNDAGKGENKKDQGSNQDNHGEAAKNSGKPKRNRWRNRQKKGGKQKDTNEPQSQVNPDETLANGATNDDDETKAAKSKPKQQVKKQQPRNNKKSTEKKETTEEESPAPTENEAGPKKANQKKRKNNRNRKRFPWRKFIPVGTMDPITLENLASLAYPPFALRASPPYLPIEWPLQEGSENRNQQTAEQRAAEAKERERRLLEEQWGNTMVKNEDSKPPANQEIAASPINNKHLNLFDGRALAYYMVSTSQFVDPLNRRDVTRDELIHLDRYLARNGFTDLNVVEAYDTKGVSLSTAGAASTTAAGRMEILQQEARVLLNALFGGQGVLPAARNINNSRNNSSNNALMQQYSNYQTAQESQQRLRGGQTSQQRHNDRNFMQEDFTDQGIFGDEGGGILVVDDDLNPSLRGAIQVRPYQPQAAGNRGTLWSGNRLTSSTNAAALQPQNFPALSTAAALPPSQSRLNSTAAEYVPPGGSASASSAAAAKPAPKKKPLPPVKSLKVIAGAVKKTTAEEAQRQFEAREEARRKAMLSSLTFGQNPASWNYSGAPQAPSTLPQPQPTEGQVERNRNLAEALGVGLRSQTPAAQSAFSGWARPTDARTNVVIYPDELILTAREKMALVTKLERRWKAFLEDDKAASLPLNKMDRPSRKLVHEYAVFWKLHTESFDPEPKRYVHCVKLLDTSAPIPLLSEAARQWRGPTGMVASYEHASQQTAGQDTRGRSPAGLDLPKEPMASNPRASALVTERPKLELKERTLPLDLPPFQPPAPAAVEVDVDVEPQELLRRRDARIEEQRRREKEREERKKKALEAAFASDDEEESLGEVDADSDWEQGEELYAGSDDEEVVEEA